MARQTKAEIDAEILDRAAGLFAQHGFQRTSLQQIADALNYSKAGLLHHYPSKKALFEAVHVKYEELVRARVAKFADMAPGYERDLTMINSSIDFTSRFPGMSEFGQQMARHDPRFIAMGLSVLEALGVDLTNPDMDRMARVFCALGGTSLAMRVALPPELMMQWKPIIINAAMAALGHSPPDSER